MFIMKSEETRRVKRNRKNAVEIVNLSQMHPGSREEAGRETLKKITVPKYVSEAFQDA